jgi:hypothetical protein
MRLDQEFICSPETRILRWYGYSRMGMDYELSDEMRLYLILVMKILSTK